MVDWNANFLLKETAMVGVFYLRIDTRIYELKKRFVNGTFYNEILGFTLGDLLNNVRYRYYFALVCSIP